MIGGDTPPNAATDDSVRAAFALRQTAKAKVNLTLEIRGRRGDGYHELESLTAFTRFGDVLELDPGRPFSLEIDGPFASAIEGGNLVRKAAELYAAARAATAGSAERRDAARLGAFRLNKQIPVAAGLGGGSADAAAALRLLAAGSIDGPALSSLGELAARLGADVPVCVFSRPAIMTGVGERVHFLSNFPAIPIVLVNPRRPLATAAVFRELRAAPLDEVTEPGSLPELASIDTVISYAAGRSNHLEAPARRLLPVIGEILDALAACPGALLARLSGSGPTCFALFREEHEASVAALRLTQAYPQWWVQATTLA